MTPVEILKRVSDAGIILEAVEERLRVDAPRGALTLELRQALAEHKAQILEHLNQQDN